MAGEGGVGRRTISLQFCKKEDQYPITHGNISKTNPGARNDIHDAVLAIQGGLSLSQLMFDPEHMQVVARNMQYFRSAWNTILSTKTMNELCEIYSTAVFRPCQEDLITYLKDPVHPRQVLWFYDEAGNTGKSRMASYLSSTASAFVVTNDKMVDIAHTYNIKHSFRRNRRTKYSDRRKTNLKQTIKAVLNKKTETKYFDIVDENANLYHNIGPSVNLPVVGAITSSIPQFFNPWADITQGTGRGQRIGDKIEPRGMKVKLWLSNKADHPNIMYHILLVRVPKTIGAVVTLYNNQYPFQVPDQGKTGNSLILPLDSDRGFKAYYDKIVSCQVDISQGPSGGKEYHRTIRMWIKKKNSRPVVYNQGQQKIVHNPVDLRHSI